MDRYWLLTWRTYGTWLPGEAGFVSDVRNAAGQKVRLNTPGEPGADPSPELAAHAATVLSEDVVYLNAAQAESVAGQLRETARVRGWQLLALAVLPNHVHVVVGVLDDPDPERLLADFKAWCTRRLNDDWGRREHWWAQSGSRRKKDSATKIREAVEYVRDQRHPLIVWLDPRVSARLAVLANGGT